MASASASADDDQGGVIRETRDTPPAHYLLKLESFSHFSKNGLLKIKSNSFQVGRHQWKIILFPNGNNGGKDYHVSIYLVLLSGKSSLPAGKGVNAIFKFFLFDQIRGNYRTVQGRERRFDLLKCEWGFDKLISLETLRDFTNGFLVNDTCFFGVEVFLSCEGSCRGECHSISKVVDVSGKYKWVINQLSELGQDSCSDEFAVGGYRWRLTVFPKGYAKHKGHSLSLYLEVVDFESDSSVHQVKVEFVLKLNDLINQSHLARKGTEWFSAKTANRGWPSFIELKDFKDVKKGFVVADQCIIEAQVTVVCEGSCETFQC